MAFSVKVIGISKKEEVLLEMEIPWWDTGILRNDPRFTESNDTGSYFDYDADFSVEEMRQIHEKFRKAANSGGFDYPDWQKIIKPMIKKIDEILYSESENISHFHIIVFEWESGL